MNLKLCSISRSLLGPTGVLDTDDTQVPPATVLDMEADRLARLNSTCSMVDSVADPPVTRLRCETMINILVFCTVIQLGVFVRAP